ncbi:NmrA family NAD(P)-binding protein [Paenibacillus jiagnxiensis]|uniref:NmrA family NAD(P)-binding protein n=1 Tax=Paenibacillus jiagnxiensis TaxID=3228926 RepID=UPI0033A3776F
MTAQQDKILVLGATGKTGSRIAARLNQLGYTVRTAGRRPGAHGTEHVHFDWNDYTTYDNTYNNVKSIYLIGPISDMHPEEVMIPFVEKAIQAGVKRFVMLSSASVPEGGPVFGSTHEALRQLAPEWAVLQPSYFMQNFTEGPHAATIRNDGTMVTATGDGRVAFVDADDIAEVGVRALIDEQPHNRAHVITGPEALSYADVARIIGGAAGISVRHKPISVDELSTGFTKAGIPADYAAFLAGLDEGIRRGGVEDQVTDTVKRVTGRRPKSLADFVAKHTAVWTPAGEHPASSL